MSGYTFAAISLNATIVISFDFVVAVAVELRLPSCIGFAGVEMLVVRLSCDVLADVRVRDACFFLRATLEVDGGGIAIASGVVSANPRLPRPLLVP